MRRIITLAALALSISAMHAVRITIPPAEQCKSALENKGFKHFIDTTNIIAQIANKSMEEKQLKWHVNAAFAVYGSQNPLVARFIHQRRNEFIKLICQQQGSVS